ncbi:MAG: hypothetical protein QM740_05085 [Acidovorax sp.]
MFDFFDQGSKAYAKRTETMLREAMFARLEHEAAAEHHQALARMYAERIERLRAEIAAGPWTPRRAEPQPPAALADEPPERRSGFRVLTPEPLTKAS